MAPLPTSSTSPENSALISTTAPNVPCSCLFSSALRFQFPFSIPSPAKHSPSSDPLVSAVEACVRTLTTAVSRNPLLRSALSFSDNIRSFCRVQTQNFNALNSRGRTSRTTLSAHNFAAILPGDSVAGLVVSNGLSNFLNLYNTLLVCRLVLTWFPGAPQAIVSPLSTLCDPYLNIFRGIIPPLGGTLDLSPILAFLVLNAFTSTAAALPAELPESRTDHHEQLSSQGLHSSQLLPLNVTTFQNKWTRRLSRKKAGN